MLCSHTQLMPGRLFCIFLPIWTPLGMPPVLTLWATHSFHRFLRCSKVWRPTSLYDKKFCGLRMTSLVYCPFLEITLSTRWFSFKRVLAIHTSGTKILQKTTTKIPQKMKFTCHHILQLIEVNWPLFSAYFWEAISERSVFISLYPTSILMAKSNFTIWVD